MNIIIEQNTLYLQKENGAAMGHCSFVRLPDGTIQLTACEIGAPYRRKGYGTYLLKAFLRHTGGYDARQETRYRISCLAQECDFPAAFFGKFGFWQQGDILVRCHKPDLTAITLMQQFLKSNVAAPCVCIDATCGNGHDTLFLAQWLQGVHGQHGTASAPQPEPAYTLLAMDIQPQAVANTKARLAQHGIDHTLGRIEILAENHANLAQYAAPESVDAILFNFGWLPGAAHKVFSTPQSSLPALNAALALLKSGGVLSATLYSGEGIGTQEKEEVLQWLRTLPIGQYTVLVCAFGNWADTAPLPCFIIKK